MPDIRPAVHHKLLILVTADPKTAMVIRRAKRVGDFLDAECFAVAVQPSGDLAGLPFLGALMNRMSHDDKAEAAMIDEQLDAADAAADPTATPHLWWEDDPVLAERFRRR